MSPAVAAQPEEKKSKAAARPPGQCEGQQPDQTAGASAGIPLFLGGGCGCTQCEARGQAKPVAGQAGDADERRAARVAKSDQGNAELPANGKPAAEKAHKVAATAATQGSGPSRGGKIAQGNWKATSKKGGEARKALHAAAGSAARRAKQGKQAGAKNVANIRARAGQAQATAATQAESAMAGAKAPEFPAAAEVSSPVPGGAAASDKFARSQAQKLIAAMNAARASTLPQIQAQSQTVKEQLTADANSVRQNMRAEIAQQTAMLRAGFAAQHAALAASLASARAQIPVAVAAAQAEAAAHGEAAKGNLTSQFTNHRTVVEVTVQTSIASAEGLRSHYAAYVHERTQEQANDARQWGAAKGASYPATERGDAQREAAIGVANRTSGEISEREPESVSAVEKIVEGIPQQFQDQGDRALDGFDQGLPDLLAKVDGQVQALSASLSQLGEQAAQQLDALGAQLSGQLDALETATMARMEAVGPEAEANLDSALAIALVFVGAGEGKARRQINQAVDGAVKALAGVEHPNLKGARRLAQQVIGFVSARRRKTVSGLGTTGGSMSREIEKIGTTTRDGLQGISRQAAQDRQAFSQSSSGAISKLISGLNTSSAHAIQSADAATAQVASQVEAHLGQAAQKLKSDFGKTLRDAEAHITQSVDQAMAKNDEGLSKLDGQMDEAADDAGWDYDHPVLAALRDIGELVAGVIVGILLVLALVVVVLVLAEVLIAGLVALGISAATAALIVEIAGLALLAYGVYSAYESRAAKGQGGVAAFFGAIGDVTGITSIYRAVTTEGLTPYERGKMFGEGIATIGLFFVGGGEGEAGEAGELGELGELGEPPAGEPPAGPEPAAPEQPVTPEEPLVKPEQPRAPEEPVTPKEEPPSPAEGPKPAEEPKPAQEPKPAEEPKPAAERKPAEEPKPAEEGKPGEEPATPGEAPREEITNEDEHLEDLEDTEPYNPERGGICFPRGTPVSTVVGLRAIDSLRPGEMVYSFDFEQHAVVLHQVLALTQGSTGCWVEIRLASGSVKATRRHPFWVESTGDWVRAEELLPGMTMRLRDGSLAEIRTIELHWLSEPEETYNLEVEEVNNFFVGSPGVLVHNISATRLKRLGRPGYSNYVLRNKSGKIYYSGMFGPGDTQAGVEYRHSQNDSRFKPKNGDYMEVIAEDLTYGESRLLEQETAVENDTIIGRDGENYRGNRQNPLAEDKFAEYQDYVEKCG